MKRGRAVIAVAALAGVVLIVGSIWGWAWLGPVDRWLDAFVRSAGFGALAALVAAVIAYRGVAHRIFLDRDLEATRRMDAVESAERTRRWEMIMWVYDNIDTTDPDRMAAVLESLAGEIRTDLEAAMLAGIVDERLDGDTEVDQWPK